MCVCVWVTDTIRRDHKVHAVLLPGIPDVRDFESPRSNPECLPTVEGKVACIGFGSLEQKT